MKIRVKVEWERGNILGLLHRITGKRCSTIDDLFNCEYPVVDIHGGTIIDRIRLKKYGYQFEVLSNEHRAEKFTIRMRIKISESEHAHADRIVVTILQLVHAQDISIRPGFITFEVIDATDQDLEALVATRFDIEVAT